MANFSLADGEKVIPWLDRIELTPEQELSLSTTHATTPLVSDISMDDPWDWPIDRVVQELCTLDRSWQPRARYVVNLSALFGKSTAF